MCLQPVVPNKTLSNMSLEFLNYVCGFITKHRGCEVLPNECTTWFAKAFEFGIIACTLDLVVHSLGSFCDIYMGLFLSHMLFVKILAFLEVLCFSLRGSYL